MQSINNTHYWMFVNDDTMYIRT